VFRYGQKLIYICGLILLVGLVVGCAQTVVIERESQPAAVTDQGWQLLWQELNREEQTSTVAGRQVIVRAGSHLSLWGRDLRSSMVVATTPELVLFGQDLNPVKNFSDEELVRFAVDTARSQTVGVVGMPALTELSLQSRQVLTIEAPYGQLSGTQFSATTTDGAYTLVILRTRSGTDHIIVLGVLPHPLERVHLDAFIRAVETSQHPVAQ